MELEEEADLAQIPVVSKICEGMFLSFHLIAFLNIQYNNVQKFWLQLFLNIY